MIYIEGFECGICTPSGDPISYVNRAILRDSNALGTVVSRFSPVETGETINEIYSKLSELGTVGLISSYTNVCLFYKYEDIFFVFCPFISSEGYTVAFAYNVNTGEAYDSTPTAYPGGGNCVCLSKSSNTTLSVNMYSLENELAFAGWSTFLTYRGEFIEIDAASPDEVLPIPRSGTELQSSATIYFGLTLYWESADISVDDYNVNSRSIEFSYESLGIASSYDGAVITIPYDYRLDSLRVRIDHNVYDLGADATYGVVVPEEPGVYDPGGVQGPSGGTGDFDDGDSDDIRQLIPPGSAGPDTSNLGLYTRYLMTASQIRDFGDYLYADDIVDVVVNGIMKALFDSPAEAVISLMHYPFDVGSLTSSSGGTIWFGNINTGKSSSGIMSKSSARIEWGKLNLTEFWGNFLDYAPHTKIDLYLPWCVGSVPIDPHECLPGTLEVITNIEFDKGTCIHSVIGNKNAVIGTYSGVVGTQIPVTALDSAGKTLAFVTAAVSGLVSAGATGLAAGAGMAAGTAAGTHAYTAATIGGATSEMATRAFYDMQARVAGRVETAYTSIGQRAKSVALASAAAAFRVPANIVRNGSFNGSGASLGVQVPYIIISRPTQSVPQNYGRYYGYPSNIYASLGSLSGYTEVGSIHLEGFSCTVEERKEIEELLIGGVIL